MRRMATASLLASLVLLAATPPVARAQTLLFDYVGFDYESPDPDTLQFGEPGSGFVGLCEVPQLFAPLVPDVANNRYTCIIHDLTSLSRQTFGDFVIVSYGSGTLSLYEDARVGGTVEQYGEFPPNPTAPATFVDGTLFLEGRLDDFQFVFNTLTNSGSFEARFEVIGGSQAGNFPLNQRSGWTFSGATGNTTTIPRGYIHQIDGQVILDKPVPSQIASWGRVKALYR